MLLLYFGKIIAHNAVYDVDQQELYATDGIEVSDFQGLEHLSCRKMRCWFKDFQMQRLQALDQVSMAFNGSTITCQQLCVEGDGSMQMAGKVEVIYQQPKQKTRFMAQKATFAKGVLSLTEKPEIVIEIREEGGKGEDGGKRDDSGKGKNGG